MRLSKIVVAFGSLSSLSLAQASQTITQAYAHGSYAQAPFVVSEDDFICSATTLDGESFKFPMQRDLSYKGALAYTSQSNPFWEEPKDKDDTKSIFAFTRKKLGNGFQMGGQAAYSTLSGIHGGTAADLQRPEGDYGSVMPDLDHFKPFHFDDVTAVIQLENNLGSTYILKSVDFTAASEKNESIDFRGSFNPMMMKRDKTREPNGMPVLFGGSCIRTFRLNNTNALPRDYK